MASCKTCDDLQETSEGTGPLRVKYNQPTIYDHMSNYCHFKQIKQRDKKLKATKEKLVTGSTKFTNLKLNTTDIEEVLQNFSTQDIVKFKKSFKDSALFDVDNNDQDKMSPTRKQNRSTESLINISRSPINCPVNSCNQTIGITSVLSHFLRDHKQGFPVDFQDIEGGRRSVLIFDESIFNFNENICLGVLAYGGKDSNEESRPAVIGICRSNSFLPEKYSNFLNHLPILIMGCKTSLTSLLKDKELANQLNDPTDRSKDIIVIWLSTVETTKDIHCTITAFDHEMTSSRSTITEVRNLKYPQDPSSFLPKESNYLMLNRGEIDILSNNGESAIEMEVFVHEFDEQ